MKISLDKCRMILFKQNITLVWHINSQAPNTLSQSWDFAVVAGCPLRRSAHCSWQLYLSPPQKHAAELGKCRGQQGWAKVRDRFCGGPPLCGLPQAFIPQMPLKSTSWSEGPTAATMNVSPVCCHRHSWDAGRRSCLMAVQRNHTPDGRRLLV